MSLNKKEERGQFLPRSPQFSVDQDDLCKVFTSTRLAYYRDDEAFDNTQGPFVCKVMNNFQVSEISWVKHLE